MLEKGYAVILKEKLRFTINWLISRLLADLLLVFPQIIYNFIFFTLLYFLSLDNINPYFLFLKKRVFVVEPCPNHFPL